MTWRALEIDPVYRAILEPMTDRLFALGATGVQEIAVGSDAPALRQPWDDGPEPKPSRKVSLLAWFVDPDEALITQEVQAIQGIRRHTLRWADVPERDWEAEFRASFGPLDLGDGLIVAPPWNAPPGALIIEPGLGFGTGDHPTTRQALTALVALVPGQGETVLDVGCGSGVLALAAAKRGALAEGVDVEATALAEAERHAQRNDLSSSVQFSATPVEELVGPYDIVVANLHAELITALAPHLLRLSGRWLVLAGILADREAMVRDALGVAPTWRDQDGDWVTWRIAR
jgi:ribosomal protein L11 methyltransferase